MTKFCPECGFKNKEDSLFCEKCGAALGPVEKVEAKKRFCPKCGGELREGENFCTSCGTRIGELGTKKAIGEKYPHSIATILGYIFGFLGGLLGRAF